MRRTYMLTLLLLLFIALPAVTTASVLHSGGGELQEEGPGRGDDLARIEAWRAFLDRAHRAFFAARMSTTAVKAKIAEADERIAELKEARRHPDSDEGGRTDITADLAFLERAHRAFTAAHKSTTEVQKWIREAKEPGKEG